MKRRIQVLKITNNKLIRFEFVFCLVVLILSIVTYTTINIRHEKKSIENQTLLAALDYCSNVYTNVTDKKDVSIDEIDKCLNLLENSRSDKIKLLMDKEIKEAKKYIILKNDINSYFDNDVLKSNINLDKIGYFYDETGVLKENYRLDLFPRIKQMETQYTKINLLKLFINNIYKNIETMQLREDLTRSEYQQVLNAYNDVIQEDIQEEYLKYLEKAEEYLIYIEKIESEKKHQKEVENAWIRLNVPYISQNLNEVYNGCESASLLMGLQYKGYLSDMDIVTYSTNMPKSDDPNTGFYLDIFGKEPVDVAHWIAPAPLAKYGIDSSGNNNVIDATGFSINDLTNEIKAHNPVVIYLTYNFAEPYNWSNEVPKNLHVLLLTGYNSITDQYLLTDPFTRSSGQYKFILSKSSLEYLYNAVGKRAVVVR